MTDGSKDRPNMTAGLDIGDKHSYLCLLDTASGEVMEEGRMRTTPEAFRRRFSSEQPMPIAIEAGTHSPWVSRLLKECGHEVLVANARKLGLIYANKRKTDEIDAENLARLARLDPKLLYPLQHRGENAQAHMAIIRSRQALVGCRTQLVNHVRGAVKSFGRRLPKCPARSFHKRAAEHIPEALLAALEPVLEQIGSLTERIREYERQLETISKEGDEMLRKLLVGSAHYILGPFGSDADLRRHGEKIASRGGKNAKKRAAVAVARKLAVLLHRLWINGEVYDPLYNTHRRQKQQQQQQQQQGAA